jgi:predicted phosphodiesterase
MNRIALISDIHANLPALEAVLRDIEAQQCDAIYCLGDIVGYNADPVACLELIQSMQIPTVRGNHDEEAISESNPLGMNPIAYASLMWTRNQLNDDHKKYLRRAPFQRILPNQVVLVHATQDKPNSWGYVINSDMAHHSMNVLRDNQYLCFNGHTHVPRLFIRTVDGIVNEYAPCDLALDPANKYLINVGSVGQPRNGIPKAAYGILDLRNNCYYQRYVDYDIAESQRRIIAAGLPDFLAERLASGS